MILVLAVIMADLQFRISAQPPGVAVPVGDDRAVM